MSSLPNEVRQIDYKLWGVLMLTALMPVVYNTARIGFLGSLPSEWGYNIASQIAWVNVMYEVAQEALLLPIFFLFGQIQGNDQDFRNRVNSGAIAISVVYAVIGIFVIIATPSLVRIMAQDATLFSRTVTYIRLEAIAKLPEVLFRFFLAALIIRTRRISLLMLLSVQMVFNIVLDTFLVRIAPTSLSFGVYGIAVSNFITFSILSFVSWRMLLSFVRKSSEQGLSFRWMKKWWQIGNLSAMESLVRNSAFILMVLRLVNLVNEPGTFWLANSFIWGWLLLPILSLGRLVRHDTANSQRGKQVNPFPYLVLTIAVVFLWLGTSPLWGLFLHYVLRINDYQLILRIIYLSTPFYVIFSLNNVIDNIFYGAGRTDLMLIQSLVINLLYYGTLFILYQIGIYMPGIIQIAIMFGVGMALDSLVTFLLYWKRLRVKLIPICEDGVAA